MENIKIQKSKGVLQFGILDENGKETGEYLEFDTEDIELSLRLNNVNKLHHDNLRNLKTQFLIINKKEDVKDKYSILTRNEIEKIKATKKFYEDEEKAIDLFLGEGGTRKLLNGRKPYYTMYNDILEMIKPIVPQLTKTIDDIVDSVKDKYHIKEIDEEEFLKDDD